MYSDLCYKKREIEQLYWIATLSLLTVLVIYLMYLTISEPPPIIHHTGWPDHLPEVPGPRRLKVEGVAIIFLLLVLFGATLGRARIQKISKYLPIYITVFGIIGLLARLMSLVHYTCSADFSLSL
jgi:hypothetical protein